jgi:hypothetical protein
MRPAVHAVGRASRARLAVLQLDAGADQGRVRGALQQLAWELDKRTSIDLDPEPVDVALDAPQLHRYPFLYWAGDREFADPSEAQLERLTRYLSSGGMLLIDNVDGRRGGGFDRSVRALLARLRLSSRAARSSQPPASTNALDGTLAPLAGDHVVYQSFYLLRGAMAAALPLEALEQAGRVAVLYSLNDLSGAWNAGAGAPGGRLRTTRESALRLGVNILMYAFCLDYKRDQVHIPFLLKRRRWQAPEAEASRWQRPEAVSPPARPAAPPTQSPGAR